MRTRVSEIRMKFSPAEILIGMTIFYMGGTGFAVRAALSILLQARKLSENEIL